MPAITDLLATMDYGPSPESPAAAHAWLDQHQRRFGHWIGSRWVPGRSHFDTVNPATGAVLARVAQGTAAQVESAVKAAEAALPGWLALGDGGRARVLYALARMLQKHARLFAVLETLDRHYGDTTGTLATPYEGAHEALAKLTTAGVKLACVTNKETRHALRVLQVTDLDRYFDLTIGGDSLPEKKPHASVLRHVVSKLNGEVHRTAHVGDSSTDVEAARNAGVAAWAVPYGYNAGSPIADARPQKIFPGLLQVAEHVLAARAA